MSIILIHETGHLLTAKYFKWNIDKIYVYPLGGITKFNECINRPLKEELIIILMGPIFQLIYYYLLTILGVDDIFYFNFILLAFNLLPIYPLDGGKLVNVFLSYLCAYKLSFKLTITISFVFYIISLSLFVKVSKSYFFIIIFFFLIFKIIEEHSKRNFYFNKFLLERYLSAYRFRKTKYVKSVDNMQRDKTHLFKKNNMIVTEKEMLKKYFTK